MTIQTVTDAIRYVGVDDNTLALFENQYPVQPMGVSYNSYVILDEKIAVMDSVDARAAEEWLSNVARVLEGRSPDYLVVTHMEPDHSGSLMRLAQKYPEMKIVGNAKTFTMIKQFFGTGAFSEDRMLEVGERDTLSLGLHRLRFLLAPMVHWPEVMAAYYNKKYADYICVDAMGNLLKPDYLSNSFQIILQNYHLRRIRFHDLRHSCASLLLANGVPMKMIQEWLGHSDFSTTANIYSHLDYASKVSSAEAMLNGLGMGSNPGNDT